MFGTLKEVYKNLNPQERQYLKAGLKLVLTIGLVSIFILPFLFTRHSIFSWMDLSKQSAVGDTINGIASPFIALLAAVLTFLAFYIQYKANEEQKRQFEKQATDTATERFESRFFEMIRIHRENVNVINSRDNTSRNDLFIAMFFELKFIYNYAQNLKSKLLADHALSQNLNKEEVFNIAYTLFYSGANPDTERTEVKIFQNVAPQNILFKHLNESLRAIREEYRTTLDIKKEEIAQLEEGGERELIKGKLSSKQNSKAYCFSKSNGYLSLKTHNIENPDAPVLFWLLKEPFTGHISELGPYFEHLFQTVKYLDSQDGKIFLIYNMSNDSHSANDIPETQFNYFKLLRAQLSTYQLLLIYYHSLSIHGDVWLNEKKGELLKKYKLLKKLPIQYADFYEEPDIKLGKVYNGRAMFDQPELDNKMQEIHRKNDKSK